MVDGISRDDRDVGWMMGCCRPCWRFYYYKPCCAYYITPQKLLAHASGHAGGIETAWGLG